MDKPQNASEVMEHLIRFVEDPEEVAAMTPEQIRAELEAEGVDVEAAKARLRQRMDAAGSHYREVEG